VAERHFVRPPARHGQRGAAALGTGATVSTASGSLASNSPSRAMDRVWWSKWMPYMTG
jgi:hypothetical protein